LLSPFGAKALAPYGSGLSFVATTMSIRVERHDATVT
jgi:hypothetical protein